MTAFLPKAAFPGRLGALVLAAALVASAAARADTLLELNYPGPGTAPEHVALIEKLKKLIRSSSPDQEIFRREWLLSFATFDLNGDGIGEAIVHGPSSLWCGNVPTCWASVYRRLDGEWKYIGNVSVREGRLPIVAEIFVEDRFHQGWRTLNDGEYRSCWVANPPKDMEYLDKDYYEMPYVPGEAGYYWTVLIKDVCPVK
ncbi:MAG: hypothetical protein IH994_02950 [Proteobacteria bacterium]|nr:hypothetical protein [Pseudomonadota bacterium]